MNTQNSLVFMTRPGDKGFLQAIAGGEIIRLSQTVVKPFYRRKLEMAMAALEEFFVNLLCRVPTPEGAMFLRLWFENLPIPNRVLYERLKKRKVLVVSGDYFFPGLEPGWKHTEECLRITYSQDEEDVRAGLRIIGEEVRVAYGQGK